MKTPFLGGTYVSRSRNLAYSRCLNIYPEVVETKQGKEVGAFYGCPGKVLRATVGNGPIRGGRVVGGNAYVVSGAEVYKVTTAWASTLLGTIGTVTGPVDLFDDGTQLLISDGSVGYVVTIATGALAAVASFPAGGATLAGQDGFCLTNVAGSNQFNQSNLRDFATWNALNFSSADGQPGNAVALLDLNRELWVLCENNTEVWINAGLAGFAFQRLSGTYIEIGCAAPYSAVHNSDQSAIWIAQSEEGYGVAYRSQGYVPQRISTHSVERIWQSYSTIADAIAYSYEQEGHRFYVVTFPSGDATWAFDMTTGFWHERGILGADGLIHRDWGNCYFFFNNYNMIGDFRNGKLYSMDLSVYTDAGTTRKWLRSWRAFPPSKDPNKPTRFNGLTIECQTGVDIPQGTTPLMTLKWSNDGGHRWSNEIFAAQGKPGESGKQVSFRRLGSTRKGNSAGCGLDRVFELSGTDPVPVALIGAELDAEPT